MRDAHQNIILAEGLKKWDIPTFITLLDVDTTDSVILAFHFQTVPAFPLCHCVSIYHHYSLTALDETVLSKRIFL